MSSTREPQDPPATGRASGKPLRPYNAVQWIGLTLGATATALILLEVAGRFGWIRPWFVNQHVALPLFIGGMLMISSRREPDPDPELAAQRRRWQMIVLAILVVLLGVLTVLDLTRSGS